jgi:DNA uptake protein ComE-like DNA-binding protein
MCGCVVARKLDMPIDLNRASIEELTEFLHGIGSDRARAIVAARPFRTPDELVSRGILTERRYRRIAAYLTVGPSRKTSANTKR